MEEQQDLKTPLLDMAENDFSRGSTTDGVKHEEGSFDETLPQSPPEDTLLLPEESSMASLRFTKGGGGVTQRGGGGKDSSMGMEGHSSSKVKQEQVTDVRLVLVYGQWIWPLILFSGATNIYSPDDQWAFAMIGNALMLSNLWWITSAPQSASNTTTETTADTRRYPVQQQQSLRRSDILPTVIWGVVPPSSMFFMDRPEAFSVLLLLILLPFLLLQLVRIKRYGLQATWNGLFDCCCGKTIWNRLSVSTEHLVSFKHLEEEYFEHLREQEDEEARRLLVQQERLAYLEEESITKPRIGSSTLPRMWPMYIVFVLSVGSFGSFLYNCLVVIPRVSNPSSTMVKRDALLRPVVRSAIDDQVTPSNSGGANGGGRWVPTVASESSKIRHIMSTNEWEEVLADNASVFVHFHAPWAIWCQRLIPVWEAFSKEAARSSGQYGVEVEIESLVVAQVDCVTLKHLCTSLKVRAFPTLRWYQDGKNIQDYKADRTVNSFHAYSEQKMNEYSPKAKFTSTATG